jgi:Flp pilus assembly protein TadD
MRFSFVADHFSTSPASPHRPDGGELSERGFAAARVAVLTWRQTGLSRPRNALDRYAGRIHAWLAHNNLGNVLLDRGNADSAMAHYREAVRLKPDYYEGLGNLGAALLRRGAVEEARTTTEAALRRAPGYTPALVNRAAILLRDGRPDDAIVQLQSVLSQEPENSDALNTLGSAFAMREDYENARGAFEAALRISLGSFPSQPAACCCGGTDRRGTLRPGFEISPGTLRRIARQCSSRAGAEAIAYCRSLLPVPVFADLATPQPGGRAEEPSASFRQPSGWISIQVGNNLGIAFLIARRYAEAAEQFTEALRLRGQNPEAHNNLAYALIRLGRREEAIAHLNEALRLRPSYPEALAQLRELRR